MTDPDTADFGFARVPLPEKARRVRGVFDSVADRYDLMNDLMSLGTHRLWKRAAVTISAAAPGQIWLDVAAGTGDVAALLARRVGSAGSVVATDINAAMLENGRDRLLDLGISGNVFWVQADAEQLPFGARRFDGVTIAFGLRNVTDREAALASMRRVIRPGGKLLILEFSHPRPEALARLYDLYSFRILPFLGRVVARDSDSYRYLVESIRMHPNQTELQTMMERAGFAHCDHLNLSGGIVAIHTGYRI